MKIAYTGNRHKLINKPAQNQRLQLQTKINDGIQWHAKSIKLLVSIQQNHEQTAISQNKAKKKKPIIRHKVQENVMQASAKY